MKSLTVTLITAALALAAERLHPGGGRNFRVLAEARARKAAFTEQVRAGRDTAALRDTPLHALDVCDARMGCVLVCPPTVATEDAARLRS